MARSKAAAACVLALCLSLLALLGAGAETGEARETVRVGYYPVANYQDTTDRGAMRGFSYDYYVQIQKYTRWDYVFVQASYAECLEMLKNGEIDIMSGLNQTEERSEQMLFSRYSISNAQNKLYAREDDAALFYESFADFDGKRVALMSGTLTFDLDDYCAAHGFTLTPVWYQTPAQMRDALAAGEVDLLCSASVSEDVPTKIVAHLDRVPLYYAVSKTRSDLLGELNDALRKITELSPDFYTQMSEKYMVSGANATATFTREELSYIASGRKVYLILNDAWEPISGIDPATGEYRGIFVDVAERIAAYSGLEIVLCSEAEFNSRWVAEDPNALNDVVAILADDNAWAAAQSVMMSNHVADAKVVRVTKRGDGQTTQAEKLRIALPDRFYISWCLQDEFDADQVTYYPSVRDCLDAINAGKADATYANELVSTYFLSMLEYSQLYASASTGYDENLAFAVNKDSDAPLLSIINKSLLCIGAPELSKIVIANSIAEQRTSLRGLFYANPVLTLSISGVGLLLLAGVCFAMYTLRARRRRMTQELARDEANSAARTEFFMMISHELRTPLNAAVGYLNLAAEHCSGEGVEREYIKRAQNAARQLTGIAQDMLDYTRIASDSAVLQEAAFDLKEAIGDVEQNIALEAEKKELRFSFSIHDLRCEFVLGDRLRVTQIMQNLLSNAVKFTAAGGSVSADVAQKNLEDGTLLLVFTAKDTGKGMTEDYLQKVCAPFQQSDKAYSRTHGGLGLGLYLTKYYVDAMGGKLDVTSTMGVGSCFTVQLPLRAASSEQAATQSVDLTQLRAMILTEDEETNEQLKATLKRLGVKSDAVTDGTKAVRRIQSRLGTNYAYSLCLVDGPLLTGEGDAATEITRLDQALVLYALTDKAAAVETLGARKEIGRTLYKPIFQSVLFNAILEDFGACRRPEEKAPHADFGGLRTLVVEDNRINSDILTRILRKANVEVTLCENGRQAVQTFTESAPGTFRLVLMDIQMPIMDGHAATRAIRASDHPQAASIPILAVSANAFPEDVEKSMQAGMNAHLSKPIRVKTLYESISKYCGLPMTPEGDA